MSISEPAGRPSPRAVPFWAWNAVVGWCVFVGLQLVWMLFANAWTSPLHLGGLAVTAVVAIVHVSIMPKWRYRVHRWEITDEAVYTQAGWFSQEWRIAPLSRIQTVDTERGPIEAMFGLANVTITTASAAGPLKLHGLERSVAREISDQLTARTHALAADAT